MRKILAMTFLALFIPVSAWAQLRTNKPIMYLRSNPTVDCTAAVAQDQSCTVSIKIHAQVSPNDSPRKDEVIIRGVAIQSLQNLAWDVNFYTRNTFSRANMDADSFLDYVAFTAANGKQDSPTAGTGDQYKYQARGLDIRYRDMSATEEITTTSQVHFSIVNRSSTVKSEGADGAIVVILAVEPIE